MQCLDSSAAIELLRGSEKGRRIKELLSDSVFITAFSVHELLAGLRNSELKTVEDFIRGLEILSYDAVCAIRSSAIEKSLSKRGRKINIVDVFIASICINNNKTLITTDKDFAHIKELEAKIIS